MALLQVEDLTFRYPDAPRAALQNVSFSVEAGELLVICGASGCGKSTLLRLIKRELAPFGEKSGEIRLDGLPQAQWDERASCAEIGLVQQRPDEHGVERVPRRQVVVAGGGDHEDRRPPGRPDDVAHEQQRSELVCAVGELRVV